MNNEGIMKQCHACGSDDCVVIGAQEGREGIELYWNRCNECGYIGKTDGVGVSWERVEESIREMEALPKINLDDIDIAPHPAAREGGR